MSHNSPRSVRVKQDARTRADVVWRDREGDHQQKLVGVESKNVLSDGSELAQLIAQSDAHQAAMRKIVQ